VQDAVREIGVGEVGPGEHHAAQVRVREIGLAQDRTAHDAARKVGARPEHAAHLRVGHVGMREFGVGQHGPLRLVVMEAEIAVLVANDDEAVADIGGGEVRALEIGALELHAAQIGFRQVGVRHVAAREIGAEQIGARHLGVREGRLAQERADEFSLAQIAIAEIHALGNLERQRQTHAAGLALGHLFVEGDGGVDVVLAYFGGGRHRWLARFLRKAQ